MKNRMSIIQAIRTPTKKEAKDIYPIISKEEFNHLMKLSDTQLRDRRRAMDEEYRRKDWGFFKRIWNRNTEVRYIETAESQMEHMHLLLELGISPEEIQASIDNLVKNAR